MTPLAQSISRELTVPMNRRFFEAPPGFAIKVSEAHCFDCSDVADTAFDIQESDNGIGTKTEAMFDGMFLPAPITWVEWRAQSGRRQGFLLQQRSDGILLSQATPRCAAHICLLTKTTLTPVLGINVELAAAAGRLAVTFLAMINTPRVFGRRQHMPHAGLQRKLAAAQGMTGKFPLRAWTEIKLEVRLPRDESESGEHIAVLTGRKCLHFCRAHLRVQNGQIVFVSSCWRGDPSLGIKRSRYSLIPPRDGSPPKVFIP